MPAISSNSSPITRPKCSALPPASPAVPSLSSPTAAAFCVALIGFGFSLYLTYRELFTIHAICEWCASSAVILTLLTIGASIRYVIGEGARPISLPVAAPTSNTLGAGGQ